MQTAEEFIASAPIRDISKIPTPLLVEVYNTLSGKSINRFSSRATGENQVLKLLQAKRSEQVPDDAEHEPGDEDALWVPGRGFVEDHPLTVEQAEQLEDSEADIVRTQLEAQAPDETYRSEPWSRLDVNTHVPLYPAPASASRREREFKIKLPFSGETRAPRPNSKRAGLLSDMLGEGGISLEEVMSKYGWVKKDAYEGIRHVHVSLGYGIDQYAETGNVYAHTEEPGKHEQR